MPFTFDHLGGSNLEITDTEAHSLRQFAEFRTATLLFAPVRAATRETIKAARKSARARV